MFKRKYYTPSDSFRAFTGGILYYFLGSIVVAVILMIDLGDMLSNFISVVIPTGMLAVSVLVYKGQFPYNAIDAFSATKMREKPCVWQLLLGLGAVLGLIFFGLPIANWFEKLLELIGYEPLAFLPDVGGGIVDIIFSVFLLCLMPAVCEEMLMRGVVAGGLRRYGRVKASLTSGLLFALLHMNPSQTIYQFILGFVISYFFLTSNSLWVPIAMHFFNNLLALVLGMVLSEETQFAVFDTYGYIPLVVGGIIAGVCIWLLVHKTKNHMDADEELRPELQPKLNMMYKDSQFGHYGPSVPPQPQFESRENAELFGTAPDATNAAPAPALENFASSGDPFADLSLQQSQTASQQPAAVVPEPPVVPPRMPPSANDKLMLAIGVGICTVMWLVTFFLKKIMEYFNLG